MSYTRVKIVEPQDNYVLLLTFDNNECRELDMKPYLDDGPIFQALKDPVLFKTARLCAHTVAWANNADIAPERIYEMCL
ncbi:hypothetical protein FACS1894201_10940 [Bacteroidia bacterium]|nr:hypothetical protein FACS1894201_10940 [Bacteroidia bacterium]